MRSLILLVLSLAMFGFSNALSTPTGYTPIAWNPNNQVLLNILDYGVDQAIPKAIAAGKLPEGEWAWTTVLGAFYQVVGTGKYFNLVVDIEDGNGYVARLGVIVLVYPTASGTAMKLSNWSIVIPAHLA